MIVLYIILLIIECIVAGLLLHSYSRLKKSYARLGVPVPREWKILHLVGWMCILSGMISWSLKLYCLL